MEPRPEPKFRSGTSGSKPEETGFGLVDEIHRLISPPPPPDSGSSFTALLELPPTQAVELLVSADEEGEQFPVKHAVAVAGDSPPPPFHFPPPPPMFPTDLSLIDRASKFSVFADNTPENNSVLSAPKLEPIKQEPVEGNYSSPAGSDQTVKSGKRKEREKKVKEPSKKSKKVALNEEDVGEKLPYVHVRARRGQATDSHSLAERARREKINARMKLLQELVPGCNKISGTAMVLDEIINHVQALQRQVEFLSMRLAAVDPRVDFNFDSLFAAESGSPLDGSYQGMINPSFWPEGQINGNKHQYNNHLWHFDGLHHQPVWVREEEHSNFVTPENSLLTYNSPANSASLHSNHLKMEL